MWLIKVQKSKKWICVKVPETYFKKLFCLKERAKAWYGN
jgi:hypothetical protein